MSWSQKAGNWEYSSRCCLSMSWCLRAVFRMPLAACLRDSTLLFETEANAHNACAETVCMDSFSGRSGTSQEFSLPMVKTVSQADLIRLKVALRGCTQLQKSSRPLP